MGILHSLSAMLPKYFDTLFWFYTCPGKFTSARKTKYFIGLFMTAVNRIKCRYAHSGMTSALRHDKQGRWFSNSRGLPASVSFLSSPTPPRLLGQFFARSLLRGLWLSKQHGNACYAGYKELHTFVIAEQSDWSRKISLAMTRQITQEDINLLLTKTTAARSSQEAVMTSHCS